MQGRVFFLFFFTVGAEVEETQQHIIAQERKNGGGVLYAMPRLRKKKNKEIRTIKSSTGRVGHERAKKHIDGPSHFIF